MFLKINDSTFALSLNDGFMLINLNESFGQDSIFEPTIERLSINNKFLDISSLNIIEASYKDEISIEYSSGKIKQSFF